jgi:hypothetical protein
VLFFKCFDLSVQTKENDIISLVLEYIEPYNAIHSAVNYGNGEVFMKLFPTYMEYIRESERYDDLVRFCTISLHTNSIYNTGLEIFNLLFAHYYPNRHYSRRHHLDHGMTSILTAAAEANNDKIFTWLLCLIDDPMTINYSFVYLASLVTYAPHIISYWHRLEKLILVGKNRALRYALVKASVFSRKYAIEWLLPQIKNKKYIEYAKKVMLRSEWFDHRHKQELLQLFNKYS